MITSEEGFWYSFKERQDGRVDFEFFRFGVCVSKGWAGSFDMMLRLFDEMLRRHRARNPHTRD